jgi:hypothetical protein
MIGNRAIVEIQNGTSSRTSSLVQHFRIHAVQAHGIAAPDVGIALAVGVDRG